MKNVIKMDPASVGWAKGAQAAARTLEEIARTPEADTDDAKRALFWFSVGRQSAELSTQDEVDSFFLAAATNQPARTGFDLHFRTDTRPFNSGQDPDSQDYDYDAHMRALRLEVSSVLRRAAYDAVDLDRGKVFDSDNRRIGEFVLHAE